MCRLLFCPNSVLLNILCVWMLLLLFLFRSPPVFCMERTFDCPGFSAGWIDFNVCTWNNVPSITARDSYEEEEAVRLGRGWKKKTQNQAHVGKDEE